MSPTLLLILSAAVSARLPVAVTGGCPSAQAVAAALGSALGEAGTGPDVPTVIDQGDRFSVAARGQTRQYADPARDCDERARAAAVFIALALNPPLVPAVPEPATREPAGPPVAVAASVAPPRALERWFELAAAARLDGAPASDAGGAFGFEARASVGGRWLGAAVTAGVLAPAESQLSSVTVREQRFPVSVALTARRAVSPRFTVAGAVGAALVPLTVRGVGVALTAGSSSTRLDAGVRLAVEVRVRAAARLAPFLELHAEVFPRPYQLDVVPLGTIGSTGRFWLGVSAGLSFDVAGPTVVP